MRSASLSISIFITDGVATLRFDHLRTGPPRFDGSLPALLEPIVDRLAAMPSVRVAVLKSSHPDGFCHGWHPAALNSLSNETEAARLALHGQHVLQKLHDAPFDSIAVLTGPCLGPGFDLALACTGRLAIAGPDSWLGFGPHATGWGGATRLKRRLPESLTAREAHRTGIVERIACARRERIALRSFLDEIERTPLRRFRRDLEIGLADERRNFLRAFRSGWPGLAADDMDPETSVRPLRSVGLVGTPKHFGLLAVEWAMRGVDVAWIGPVKPSFRKALARGRGTPLELDKAAARVRISDDAGEVLGCELVLLDDLASAMAMMLERELPPRAILAVPTDDVERLVPLAAKPDRIVGYDRATGTLLPHSESSDKAVSQVRHWLGRIGAPCTLGAIEVGTPHPSKAPKRATILPA